MASFNYNANLGDAEVLVYGLNSLLDEFFGLEIHLVVGLDIDAFPKLLKLLFLVYLFLEGRLFRFTGILRLNRRRVEYGVKLTNNEVLDVIYISEIERAVTLVVEVFLGEFTFFYVAVRDEFFLDLKSLVFGNLHFAAIVCGGNKVNEHLESNLDRTVSYEIGNL